MTCEKCSGLGRVEIIEGFHEHCLCTAGSMEKYADLTQRKLSLQKDLKLVNRELKTLENLINDK